MKGLTDLQVGTLVSGLYEQANNMLPIREKSYEAGQRQTLLDVASQIAEMVRENAILAPSGKNRARRR